MGLSVARIFRFSPTAEMSGDHEIEFARSITALSIIFSHHCNKPSQARSEVRSLFSIATVSSETEMNIRFDRTKL